MNLKKVVITKGIEISSPMISYTSGINKSLVIYFNKIAEYSQHCLSFSQTGAVILFGTQFFVKG